MSIQQGATVVIEYTGTLDDGTVFDSSEKHGKPLEFTIGSTQVIPGFEAAVQSMSKGEEKDITIAPADAYGEPKKEFQREVPRAQLPQDELKAGMMLAVRAPDGRQFPATIVSVDDEKAVIDFNHPLAGKTLHFKLKLVDVKEAVNT